MTNEDIIEEFKELVYSTLKVVDIKDNTALYAPVTDSPIDEWLAFLLTQLEAKDAEMREIVESVPEENNLTCSENCKDSYRVEVHRVGQLCHFCEKGWIITEIQQWKKKYLTKD